MKPQCENCQELIIRHDSLNAHEASVLAEHLADCPNCSDLMAQMENLGERLMYETITKMPPDLSERIMNRVKPAELPVPEHACSWQRETGILASLAAILCLLSLLLHQLTWQSMETFGKTVTESLRAGFSFIGEYGADVVAIGSMASSFAMKLEPMATDQNVMGGLLLAVVTAGLLLWGKTEKERDYPCVAQHSRQG